MRMQGDMMIKVTIYKTKNHEYKGFDMVEHSGMVEPGDADILCAAVSMLVINTINSIERFTDDETSYISDEESAAIEFRFTHVASADARLLLHSMVLGLESLEDNREYEPYIDIIFEEV